MEKYNCRICNRKHTIYNCVKNIEPYSFSKITENNRKDKISDNIYTLDDQYLFCGHEVKLNVDYIGNYLSFFLWIKIKMEDLIKAKYNSNGNKVITLFGYLDCVFPFYEKLQGLKAKALIDLERNKLKITVLENSLIKDHLESQITKNSFFELMNNFYHKGEKIVEYHSESFINRLKESLDKLIIRKKEIGENLVIDIMNTNELLFQITDFSYLENEDKTNGFGLHISFDENIIYKENLLNSSFFNSDFKIFNLNGVEICQYYFDYKMISIVEKVVTEVYKENPNEVFISLL